MSWGFTDFRDISDLEGAINKADGEMYARKQARKLPAREDVEFAAPIGDTPPQSIAA